MKNYLLHLDKEFLRLIKVISDKAYQQNISVYLVGGIVRDILLGEKVFDIDVVVEADAIDFAKYLSKCFNARCVTYNAFGTASLFLSSVRIDFVTARSEIYKYPGALPTVKKGALIEDLFRRDFTINAMALSLNKNSLGALIDPYNGLEDLKKKKICVLHDKSFIDDPTRILRAVRFEQRLGFSIEKKTLILLKTALENKCFFAVNIHRSFLEFKKMLEENPCKCLKRLNSLFGMEFLVGTKKICLGQIRSLEHKKWIVCLMALLKEMRIKEREMLFKKFSLTKKEKKALAESLKVKDILTQLSKKDLTRLQVCVILKPFEREALQYFLCLAKNIEARKKIEQFLRK